MLGTWALEIALVLAAVQLLAVFYFYHRRRDESTRVDSSDTGASNPPEEGSSPVECHACGTENDREYRYCRRCVADLSAESIPGHRGHSPSGRSL